MFFFDVKLYKGATGFIFNITVSFNNIVCVFPLINMCFCSNFMLNVFHLNLVHQIEFAFCWVD